MNHKNKNNILLLGANTIRKKNMLETQTYNRFIIIKKNMFF